MAQETENNTGVQERSATRVKKPAMYRVILHNDDYTPMEFVVEILIKVFRHPLGKASKIMMQVHKENRAQVGVYTYDIAATKVSQTRDLAKRNEYPLKATVEKA